MEDKESESRKLTLNYLIITMNYKDYQTKKQDTFVEKMSKLAFLGWIAAIITITITYLL